MRCGGFASRNRCYRSESPLPSGGAGGALRADSRQSLSGQEHSGKQDRRQRQPMARRVTDAWSDQTEFRSRAALPTATLWRRSLVSGSAPAALLERKNTAQRSVAFRRKVGKHEKECLVL